VIRPGDIVRVDAEHPATYEVVRTSREGARRGHLIVKPVCRGHERITRDLLTREVAAHWRRVGAR